jgi:hypothetical protein
VSERPGMAPNLAVEDLARKLAAYFGVPADAFI